MLQTRDGQLADTAMAQVTLAEIPFVSLRHGLPTNLLAGVASFNDTVAAARASARGIAAARAGRGGVRSLQEYHKNIK